jgi:hypothetical protein
MTVSHCFSDYYHGIWYYKVCTTKLTRLGSNLGAAIKGFKKSLSDTSDDNHAKQDPYKKGKTHVIIIYPLLRYYFGRRITCRLQ